jgi:hypothetical protein
MNREWLLNNAQALIRYNLDCGENGLSKCALCQN